MNATVTHPFRYASFERDPYKYTLFKTAIVNTNVLTHNGESDLHKGEYVALEWAGNVWNHLFRRQEPIYRVSKNGKEWGTLYASALADFCL